MPRISFLCFVFNLEELFGFTILMPFIQICMNEPYGEEKWDHWGLAGWALVRPESGRAGRLKKYAANVLA
jgi:hypothetical protein